MMKGRTLSDDARYYLARKRDGLLRSEKNWPTKEEVLAMPSPSYEEVLVTLTNADLKAMADGDALYAAEYSPRDGIHYTGNQLIDCLQGWDPNDEFFDQPAQSEPRATTPEAAEVLAVSDAPSKGRPRAAWRKRATALMVQTVHDEGLPEVKDHLIVRIQSRLLQDGIDAPRSTLQPEVDEIFDLMRRPAE